MTPNFTHPVRFKGPGVVTGIGRFYAWTEDDEPDATLLPFTDDTGCDWTKAALTARFGWRQVHDAEAAAAEAYRDCGAAWWDRVSRAEEREDMREAMGW